MRRTVVTRIARFAACFAGIICLVSLLAACDPGGVRDASETPSAPASAAAPTSTVAPSATAASPREAAALSYEGEFEDAIDAFATVAADGPDAGQQAARFQQAQLLLRTERFGEARDVLDAYLADAGAAADADVARFMQATALARLDDPAGALDSYARYAAAGGILAPYARAEQAVLLASSGRFEEARVAADAVLVSGLRRAYVARFSLRLADAYRDAGADLDALGWYARARGAGDEASAIARAGPIKRRLGDPGWIADYQLVINGSPESGVAAALLDELDAASVPVNDYARGVVEYRARRDGDARTALVRAIAAGDHAAEATYYIAAIDERGGDYDDAIAGYDRAQRLDPSSALADNALWWRGRLLEGAGRFDDASAVYAALVDGYPGSEWSGDARFHRGLAFYRAGEYAAAALAWAAIDAGASDDERGKMLFWRGRAELAARLPAAPSTFRTLIGALPGSFYALRAQVLLGENNTAAEPRALGSDAADWDAIASEIARASGFDPRIEATPGPPDDRWAIGGALEDAGEHDESVAVYAEIINDSAEDGVAALYRTTRRLDEEGRTSLAARAASRLRTGLSAAAAPVPDDVLRVAYPLAYGDLVAAASASEGISPLLMLALVRQESFYDPRAGSSAGALGLTQVIAPTGRAIADELGVAAFTVNDLYRPRLSLRFGASYIADQLAAFDGNAYHALAAYNGGPGTASNAIDAAGGDIDLFVEYLEFDETKRYVKLVMENYAEYRHLYAGLDRPSLPQ